MATMAGSPTLGQQREAGLKAHRRACDGQGSGAVVGRGCDVLLRCRAEPLRRRSRTLGLVRGLAVVEAGVGPMASGLRCSLVSRPWWSMSSCSGVDVLLGSTVAVGSGSWLTRTVMEWIGAATTMGSRSGSRGGAWRRGLSEAERCEKGYGSVVEGVGEDKALARGFIAQMLGLRSGAPVSVLLILMVGTT